MNSTKKKWWQDKVAYQIYPKSRELLRNWII